jgi:hypothetical protein
MNGGFMTSSDNHDPNSSSRTDVEAIEVRLRAELIHLVSELRADLLALIKQSGSGGRSGGSGRAHQLMEADRRLKNTFGPTGKTGRHGVVSLIPASRPKRVVFIREGHREPALQPAKLQSARVTSQVRSQSRPGSASKLRGG